jgi:hypothetical protein
MLLQMLPLLCRFSKCSSSICRSATLQAVLLNHAVGTGKFTSEQTALTAMTAGGGTLTYSAFANGTLQ